MGFRIVPTPPNELVEGIHTNRSMCYPHSYAGSQGAAPGSSYDQANPDDIVTTSYGGCKPPLRIVYARHPTAF
ncbi:MAG: hypothetical protein AAGF95_26550, partial [Chloroflexota bacterium]